MQSRMSDAGHLFQLRLRGFNADVHGLFSFTPKEKCLAFYEGKFLSSPQTPDSLEISSEAIAEKIQVGLCHICPPVTV